MTDWTAGVIADFGIETDYPVDDPDAYVHAVAKCEAVLAEVAEDAKSDLLLRFYGVETSVETRVDGTTDVDTDTQMMAQMSDIYGDVTRGATPPSGEVEELVKADGIPLF